MREWSAVETARKVTNGDVSAVEVAEAHLGAAEANRELGAITRLDETAIDQAAAIDRRRAAGESLGPLAGVPVTVKDNVDVAGQSSPNGLAMLNEVVALEDAPTVEHLRRAGAVILGRTNTPEFSWRWHTDNPLFGPTLNPVRPDLTPGGSSGGAAAALAAGIGCLAQGNDAGGSVRWPAACCGVSGLRPTQGRIPGHSSTATVERPLGIDLMATQGPLARTVDDVGLFFDVLSQPSWRDPAWVPAPVATEHRSRVGFCDDAWLRDAAPVHAEVVVALARARAVFEAVGWDVVPVEPPPLAVGARAWAQLINTDFAVRSREVMEREGSPAIGRMLEVFDRVGPALDLAGVYDALAVRAVQLRAWQELLTNSVDVIVVPVAAEPAWPVGDDLVSVDRLEEIFRGNAILVLFNLLGLPAMAQPVGSVEGRPASVQLVGRRFAEGVVLDAARCLEGTF